MPPAPLGPTAAHWFDARVRALAAPGPAAPGDDARWSRVGPPPPTGLMARIEAGARRRAAAEPRIALTWAAGWLGGTVAGALAVAAVRDRVVVTGGLDAMVAPGGWIEDLRLTDARVVVPPDHPWAGRAGVGTVVAPALPGAWLAAVVALCGPTIDALARRARRAPRGMWGQVADAVGHAAARVAAADGPGGHRDVAAATAALLTAPGAPWPARPALRSRTGARGAVLVAHRGSCCLAYRCARPGGDAAPPYCPTCVLRRADEVDRLAVAPASGV